MSSDRRSYGTGTLYRRADSRGRQWWYGRWHNGVSRPNRKMRFGLAAAKRALPAAKPREHCES
jgi:hypothetical protein